MAKQWKNDLTPPSQVKVESRILPTVITAEMVASMPVEAVEVGLREMGLDPHQPLPVGIRRIANSSGSKTLRWVTYCGYIGRRAFRRLLNVTSTLVPLNIARLSAHLLPRRPVYLAQLVIASIVLTTGMAYLMKFFGSSLNGHAETAETVRIERTMPLIVTAVPPSPIPLPTEDNPAVVNRDTVTDAYKSLRAGARVRLRTGARSRDYVVADVADETGNHHTTVRGTVMVEAMFTPKMSEFEWEVEKSLTKPQSSEPGAAVAAASPTPTMNGAEVAPHHKFTATAYALRGRTASGATIRRGLIAADRRVLPLGSRVRLEAGAYSGEYVVADRGGAVRGRIIDIWVPSTGEAMRFGRRPVKLTVLSYGAKPATRAAKPRR